MYQMSRGIKQDGELINYLEEDWDAEKEQTERSSGLLNTIGCSLGMMCKSRPSAKNNLGI